MVLPAPGDVFKAGVYVALTTLPVVQVVLSTTKEPILPDLLQPCNDFRCMYMRSHTVEHMPASIGASRSGLVTLQNGGTWEGFSDSVNTTEWNAELTCEGVRSTQEYCASYKMMKNIGNPMAHEKGRYLLLGTVMLKGLCDFIHDVLLLSNRDALADAVSLVSVTVAGAASMISFRWMAGIAQVLAAHDEAHQCTCYYVRREILVLCGFAVPLVYLLHFMRRCKNTLKGLTYGSYLYFFNERVPVRLLRANHAHRHIGSLGGSLLAAELVADVAPERALLPPSAPPSLGGWVPEWPSLSELPRTVYDAIRTPGLRSSIFVFAPVVLESHYLVNAVRKALPLLESEFTLLGACDLVVTVLVQVLTVLSLLCAASYRATPEARVSIYMIWLQKWVVWMTQSPLIPLLYVRGILYIGQYVGLDLNLTPPRAMLSAKLCGFAVLATATAYILHNYHELHLQPKRSRPVLLEEPKVPSEVALMLEEVQVPVEVPSCSGSCACF